MIAKGNPHNDGPYLARYLAADSKGNERAELAELRGFASDNIFDAFALGQLMASGTRCEKPFFHVGVRLPEGEALSREQWQQAADLIEMQLGFDDQPRAIVFHQKEGQDHMHLVWSRIDADTMRAIDPGLYKNKLKEISRILEKDMGLQRVRNERDPEQKTQSAPQDEFKQSSRLKTDLKEIRETIRECWDMSDNGRSFTAALDEEGLILARGDQRDFVVVDQAGGIHALGKSITGVTAKYTRERMADVDRKKLPDVDQAKAWQREKEATFMPDRQVRDEENSRSQPKEDTEQAKAAEKYAAEKELDINDPYIRHSRSLAKHYDKRKPYSSLADTAKAEHDAFLRDREKLDRKIARATDPLERKSLGLQKKIESAEYMEITSSRLASQSEAITGRANSDEAVRQREKATGFHKEAQQHRKEFRELQKTRLMQEQPDIPQSSTTDHQPEKPEPAKAAQHPEPERRSEEKPSKSPQTSQAPEHMVEERLTGQQDWKTQPLSEFMKTAQSKQPQRDVSYEDLKRDPSLRDDYYAGKSYNQLRDKSLERIRQDMKAGRKLGAGDLQYLTRDEMKKVRNWGGQHLKEVVQEHAQQREKERGRER